MDSRPDLEQRIAAVASLDQPLRRDLYRWLADQDRWTTRDDAAAALDIPRSVAAFHLDKLAEAGVVQVRFERLGGRTGPGAGRPSKLYRPADGEVAASVPDRQYDLAGSLLAGAVAEATRTGTPVDECLHSVAHAAGRELGEAARATESTDVVDLLAQHGYEPEVDQRGEIALSNCPFHRLAEGHRDLVCGMNLDFLEGVLDGIEPTDALCARLDPAPGYCCVRIAAGR
ncbi:MAG TPA: helix-turn-helix domain-containing protein [Ilumatobacteraceae bacterium]|nr:helix-turn-helix domain-containing protein [Ilumatobacteraceae bacterium]